MDDNSLDRTAILADLNTNTLPKDVYCFIEVGSSMDVARELLEQLPEDAFPILIQAEVQHSGRGRQGRRWDAPPGSALLLSLVLRPSWLSPSQAISLIWMASVALCEAIREVSGVQAVLKWPNDVLIPLGPDQQGYGKTAGILVETNSNAKQLEWAIIGMGINVHAHPETGHARYQASDISAAKGEAVNRLELLRALLRRLDWWHGQLLAGKQGLLFHAWRNLLITIGQHVEVQTATDVVRGYVEDVEPNGALRIREETTQHIRHISSGDVGLI